MNKRLITLLSCLFVALASSSAGRAQVYDRGLIDKSIAIIGNDVILLSDLESEVKMMQANGEAVDRNARCKVLENMLVSKLFLTQARLDSLVVTEAQVSEQVERHMNEVLSALGGEKATEEGLEVSMQVILSYGDNRKSYDWPLRILGPEDPDLTETERLRKLIAEMERDTKESESFLLPEEM